MKALSATFCKCDDTTPVVVVDASATCPTTRELLSKIDWQYVYEQEEKLHAPRNRHERRAEAARRRRGIA